MLKARYWGWCRAGKLQQFITGGWAAETIRDPGTGSNNKGFHLSCGWLANWFWIIWTICSILAGWGVWLECRMGRRQGWVQTEDECSVEQLHAFVRYLSGVCWWWCCTIPTIPAFDPHSPRPPPTRGHPSNASGGVGHFMPHFSSCSTIWCHYLGFIILSVHINTKKSA